MENPEIMSIERGKTLEDHLVELHFQRAGYSRIEGSGWHQISTLDISHYWWLLITSNGFLWNGRSNANAFAIATVQLKRDVDKFRMKNESGEFIRYGMLDDGRMIYICPLNKL